MTRVLPRSFYARATLDVARDLLGHGLVREVDGIELVGRIVETEAYVGEEDPASHAAVGRTARNAVMYGPPGRAYMYVIYGMHHCLNIVTEREGYPAAVLVRALEPVAGLDWMRRRRGTQAPEQLASGPGRLCQAFGLSLEHNGVDLARPDGALRVVRGSRRGEIIAAGPRVGIRKAADWPYRFYLAGNRCVSRGPQLKVPAAPAASRPRPPRA